MLAARRPPGWFRLWQIIFCDSTLWCAGVSPTIPSHLLGHPREWGLGYHVSSALRQGQTVKTLFFFFPSPHSGSPPAASWCFNVCLRWYYRVQRSLVIDAMHLIPHAVLQSGWWLVVGLNTSLITALSIEVVLLLRPAHETCSDLHMFFWAIFSPIWDAGMIVTFFFSHSNEWISPAENVSELLIELSED